MLFISVLKKLSSFLFWLLLASILLFCTIFSVAYLYDNIYDDTALYNATFYGDEELVKNLLEKGAHVNIRTEDGWTALEAATQKGYTKIAELLIKAGADLNVQDTNNGYTALLWAAQEGHTKIAELLIKEDADLNVQDTNNGYTALLWAAQEGHTKIAELLIKEDADLDIRDNNGATALLWATHKGYKK